MAPQYDSEDSEEEEEHGYQEEEEEQQNGTNWSDDDDAHIEEGDHFDGNAAHKPTVEYDSEDEKELSVGRSAFEIANERIVSTTVLYCVALDA